MAWTLRLNKQGQLVRVAIKKHHPKGRGQGRR
jgi:hypothetical protein